MIYFSGIRNSSPAVTVQRSFDLINWTNDTGSKVSPRAHTVPVGSTVVYFKIEEYINNDSRRTSSIVSFNFTTNQIGVTPTPTPTPTGTLGLTPTPTPTPTSTLTQTPTPTNTPTPSKTSGLTYTGNILVNNVTLNFVNGLLISVQ